MLREQNYDELPSTVHPDTLFYPLYVPLHQWNPMSTISINKCQFIVGAPFINFTFLYCQTPNRPYQSIWENCINNCCYGMMGSSYPLANYDILTLCQQHPPPEEEKDTDLMVVGVSVAGLLIFVGLLIITCRLLSLICDNRVVQAGQNQDGDGTVGFTIGNNTKWIKCLDQGNFPTDLVCSICLEGNPFVQLPYKHFFHSQCIGLWLKKSHFCPNCNSKDTYKIKQYCQKCHQGYFIIRKKTFLENLEVLRKIACVNCEDLGETDDAGRASTSWRCEYDNNRFEKSTDNVILVL